MATNCIITHSGNVMFHGYLQESATLLLCDGKNR